MKFFKDLNSAQANESGIELLGPQAKAFLAGQRCSSWGQWQSSHCLEWEGKAELLSFEIAASERKALWGVLAEESIQETITPNQKTYKIFHWEPDLWVQISPQGSVCLEKLLSLKLIVRNILFKNRTEIWLQGFFIYKKSIFYTKIF